MNLKSRLRRTAATTALLAVALLAPATAAHAGLEQCAAGYACIWVNDQYDSSFHRTYNSKTLGYTIWDNTANSVASYGNSYCTRFYDSPDRVGSNLFFSYPARGGTIRDPYLKNGGGEGGDGAAVADWENRVSSIVFVAC